MKQNWCRQCKLISGNTHQTIWLDEKDAVKGNIVTLKSDRVVGREWVIDSIYDGRELSSRISDQAHNSDAIWTATSGSCPRGNK